MPALEDLEWHDLPVASLCFREECVELDVTPFDESTGTYTRYRLTLSEASALTVSMHGQLSALDRQGLEVSRFEHAHVGDGRLSGTLGLLPGGAGYWELAFEGARWSLEHAVLRTLFDLREHPHHGLVRVANEHLASARPEYLERFGAIGSKRWWEHYDAGRISRTEHVGQVVHVGPTTDEFEEACDIVRIRTDRREIEYDREGYWRDEVLTVGSWIHIEQVQAVVPPVGKPTHTAIIDVRVWVEGGG